MCVVVVSERTGAFACGRVRGQKSSGASKEESNLWAAKPLQV